MPGRFRPAALFQPASVAVIGGQTEAGLQVLANLNAAGFKGPILTADTPAAIAALSTPPDLAVICAPAESMPASFAALAGLGTRAAVVISMAAGLRDLARETGLRAFGPGSFGIAVPAIGLNATRAHLQPRPGRLALVSQSAALCRAVLDWAEPNGVGFSHIIGIGGNEDLGFAPALDWLSRDPGTGAILLDIRRIKDRRLFLSAARAAARLRPMVAIRAGGRLMDPSGDADATFVAALRRCGVLCVDTLEDLLTAAETLTRARPARGEALAIVTNAIGPAQFAADAALRDGLHLAELAPETRAVIQLTLPNAFSANTDIGNIVYVGLDNPIRLAETASLLSGAKEVGGVLIVHAPTGPADAAAIAAIAATRSGIRVPLLACVMGETTGAAHRRTLAEAGIPVFPVPEQAVRGFLHLVQDRRNRAAARELPTSIVLTLAPDRAAVTTLFAAARAAGRDRLGGTEALAALAAYGIPTLPAQSRELRIHVGDDPVFGPTIAFGQGGAADLPLDPIRRDRAIDVPPLNLTLAHALIGRTRVAASLCTSLDQQAADALVRVSQLVVDFPEIAGLDLNPLFADASIRLRPPGEAGSHAKSPYPAELAGQYTANETTYTIRPIRPEDAEAHAAFFGRLTPEDIRYRFFSAMRELSAEQIARLTAIDYDREMAFVAVRGTDPPETVGVGRLVRDSDGQEGEFAIAVQGDTKGTGLARHLMQRLMDWGRDRGMRAMVGQVLADNRPMLAFVRRLGFTVHRVPNEADIMEARLALTPPDAVPSPAAPQPAA
jgi:acyl-CoA synthetase (NDP forming)/GNAT superfamily N-acetyltransferase